MSRPPVVDKIVEVIESNPTSILVKVRDFDGFEFWVKRNRIRTRNGKNVLVTDLASRKSELNEQRAVQSAPQGTRDEVIEEEVDDEEEAAVSYAGAF